MSKKTIDSLAGTRITNIRDLEQNSRGRRRQRRQNNKTNYRRQKAHVNKTNYRRQKAHVNMSNKADIRAVLLSCETSTAPFPRCLQNVADISSLYVLDKTPKAIEFQIKWKQTVERMTKIRGLRRNIFIVSRRSRCRPALLKVPITQKIHPYNGSWRFGAR